MHQTTPLVRRLSASAKSQTNATACWSTTQCTPAAEGCVTVSIAANSRHHRRAPTRPMPTTPREHLRNGTGNEEYKGRREGGDEFFLGGLASAREGQLCGPSGHCSGVLQQPLLRCHRNYQTLRHVPFVPFKNQHLHVPMDRWNFFPPVFEMGLWIVLTVVTNDRIGSLQLSGCTNKAKQGSQGLLTPKEYSSS